MSSLGVCGQVGWLLTFETKFSPDFLGGGLGRVRVLDQETFHQIALLLPCHKHLVFDLVFLANRVLGGVQGVGGGSIKLPARGDNPLDRLEIALLGRLRQCGFAPGVRLIDLHPGVGEEETKHGTVLCVGEGHITKVVLQVDIDVRMGQEQGDDGTVFVAAGLV